ncbi:hypothetical protein NQ318_009159 [Aromia moschata]|uniref:Uncharacterized protein n=1 Tax=Aromia moschata TaxID=1265417 RepID=A0AAV8XVG9_9CUCU|nr:hypothetical protein NQ318_009159 [Aromia moschata]
MDWYRHKILDTGLQKNQNMLLIVLYLHGVKLANNHILESWTYQVLKFLMDGHKNTLHVDRRARRDRSTMVATKLAYYE